jgi:hypothetical protein
MQFLVTSNIYKYFIGVENEDTDLVGGNAVRYLFLNPEYQLPSYTPACFQHIMYSLRLIQGRSWRFFNHE